MTIPFDQKEMLLKYLDTRATLRDGGGMNNINPCNCSTCTEKQKVKTPRWAGDVELQLGERCSITGQIIPIGLTSVVGCLSHPKAREYLMKDELMELGRLRATLEDEIVHEMGILYGYNTALEEAINIIKNGVKKE